MDVGEEVAFPVSCSGDCFVVSGAVVSGISEVLLEGVFAIGVVSAGGSFGTVVYS